MNTEKAKVGRKINPIDADEFDRGEIAWRRSSRIVIRNLVQANLLEIAERLDWYPPNPPGSECFLALLEELKARDAYHIKPEDQPRSSVAIGQKILEPVFPDTLRVAKDWLLLRDDIIYILQNAWATWEHYDTVPTEAGVRAKLGQLLKVPDDQIARAVDLDEGHTSSYIARHWPGGKGDEVFSRALPSDPEPYKDAITAAIHSIPDSQAGRPKGTKNRASRLLGRDMARLYHQITGKELQLLTNRITGEAYGHFHDFVASILLLIPRDLLREVHPHSYGDVKLAAHIARLGKEHFDDDSLDFDVPGMKTSLPKDA